MNFVSSAVSLVYLSVTVKKLTRHHGVHTRLTGLCIFALRVMVRDRTTFKLHSLSPTLTIDEDKRKQN